MLVRIISIVIVSIVSCVILLMKKYIIIYFSVESIEPDGTGLKLGGRPVVRGDLKCIRATENWGLIARCATTLRYISALCIEKYDDKIKTK